MNSTRSRIPWRPRRWASLARTAAGLGALLLPGIGSVLLAAILTGVIQMVLCARGLFLGYIAFLSLRSQQYEHVLKSTNVTTQAWLVLVLFVEYVIFHPFPLILLYLAFEGVVRFVGGVCVSEVVCGDRAACRMKRSRSALVRDALREHLRRMELGAREERDHIGYSRKPQACNQSMAWEAEAKWPPE